MHAENVDKCRGICKTNILLRELNSWIFCILELSKTFIVISAAIELKHFADCEI